MKSRPASVHAALNNPFFWAATYALLIFLTHIPYPLQHRPHIRQSLQRPPQPFPPLTTCRQRIRIRLFKIIWAILGQHINQKLRLQTVLLGFQGSLTAGKVSKKTLPPPRIYAELPARR